MLSVQPRPKTTPDTDPEIERPAARELTDRRFLTWLVFVLGLSATLYMVLAANWPKFSRAEVFFAECAREMLAKSNFVTPLYHDKPFFDKPILTYWLILGMFKTFGVSHLTARLPSILAALATVATTAVATTLLWGRRAGLLSAMSLASSFMFFSFASLCMSDMLLVLFDTVTLVLLYIGTVAERRRDIMWWLASVSMGLAFLVKGPVGLVLPGLFFLTYLTVGGQLRLVRSRHILAGLITLLAVASPWFLAAWQSNGAESMYWFFIRENFQRFAGSTYDSHRPPWYMALSLLSGFSPWSVFLPVALWGSIQSWRADFLEPQSRREFYLWLWVGVVTLFFSLSRGKIDYYVLPAYPAAAALVGFYLDRWITQGQRPAITVGWLFGICLLVAGVGSVFALSPLVGSQGPAQWMLMPGALALSGILMLASMWQRQVFRAYGLAFTGLSLAVIGFSLQLLPTINKLQPCLDYARIVRESPRETRIGMDKPLENWIDEVTFQTGREPIKIEGTNELVEFLSGPGPSLAMVPRDRFEKLPQSLLASVRIIDSRPYISHALNPGYAFKRKGRLAGDVPLVLVSNRP